MATQQQPSETNDNAPPRALKGRELEDFEWLQSVTLDSIVLDEDMTQVVSINGFDLQRLSQKCLRRLCVKFKIANYKNRNKERVLQLILDRRLRMLRIEKAMAQQRNTGVAPSGEASSVDNENAPQHSIQQDTPEQGTASVHELSVNNDASARSSSTNNRSGGAASGKGAHSVQASSIDNNSTSTFSFANMNRLPFAGYAPYTAALATRTSGCSDGVGGSTIQQGPPNQTMPSVHAVSVDNNPTAIATNANSNSGGGRSEQTVHTANVSGLPAERYAPYTAALAAMTSGRNDRGGGRTLQQGAQEQTTPSVHATSERMAGSLQASSVGDNVTSPFSFGNMSRLPVARYAPYTEATRTVTREIPGIENEGKSALAGREKIKREMELLALMEEYDTSLKRKREELDELIQQTHEARVMIDILKNKRGEALEALQSASSSSTFLGASNWTT
ncbi:hypothetical protein MHU86_10192 [Fragilaria crotonensis]|nr:hypothetical protein MHU86_10192 [Fragilaria crotonensis]